MRASLTSWAQSKISAQYTGLQQHCLRAKTKTKKRFSIEVPEISSFALFFATFFFK
jgi:hypothetical protein